MQTSKKKRPKRIRRSPSVVFYVALSVALSVIAALALTTRPAGNATAEPALRIVNEDDMTLIPTPARAVARGERMNTVPLAMLQWPRSKVSGEYLAEIGNYKDAVALTPLPKLLPIPVSALSMNEADLNGVTDSIPPGMRAITIRVDAQSAVEGWAQSGSHVDVLLVKPDAEQKGRLKTRVIAQDIKVLSVNSSAEPARSDQVGTKAPATVTLLTSQQDALTITTAANLGRLMFALRGADDRRAPEVVDVDQSDIEGYTDNTPKNDEPFQGVAQADGKTFVLSRGKRWMQSTGEQQKPADSTRASLAVPQTETAQAADSVPTSATTPQ